MNNGLINYLINGSISEGIKEIVEYMREVMDRPMFWIIVFIMFIIDIMFIWRK